jgi:rhodanese-related sulfurtransferase/TusA-related sulfurtransferase
MSERNVSATVDARGLSCPMPILRARKAMDTIAVGEVLEVLASDKGAPADFRAWCQQTDQKFLGLTEENGYFRLTLKKVVAETKEKGRVYPHELTNEELASRLAAGTAPVIIDVREEAEYKAGHLPGAMLVPIEQIEDGLPGVAADTEVAVVCRTARRSDYACQILARSGFAKVYNVVPGMSGWTGPISQ